MRSVMLFSTKGFKKIFLIAVACMLLLPAANVFAQARKLRKADKAFKLFQFDKAIKGYTKILSRHPDNYTALSKLADVYRITGDYENAAVWFGLVVKQMQSTPTQKFYYAQMLR